MCIEYSRTKCADSIITGGMGHCSLSDYVWLPGVRRPTHLSCATARNTKRRRTTTFVDVDHHHHQSPSLSSIASIPLRGCVWLRKANVVCLWYLVCLCAVTGCDGSGKEDNDTIQIIRYLGFFGIQVSYWSFFILIPNVYVLIALKL